MSKFDRPSPYVQLQGAFSSGGGQMPLISCSLWISVDLWSSLKMKSGLMKTTQVSVPNPIV